MYGDALYNPYINPYAGYQQNPYQQQPKQEVVKVNGENGARAFRENFLQRSFRNKLSAGFKHSAYLWDRKPLLFLDSFQALNGVPFHFFNFHIRSAPFG